MRHAREDYNRFQDPAGLIPKDEPVFILRGQDKYAPQTVEFYATLVEDGKNSRSQNIINACRNLAQWMRDWPKHKEPDLKEELNG